MSGLDLLEFPEVAVQLVVGVLADGAGVENHDVGHAAVDGHVTCVLQETGHPFGIMDIHLATEGADLIRAFRPVLGCQVAPRGLDGLLKGCWCRCYGRGTHPSRVAPQASTS
ncbi:hypothetical protein GCM10023063_29270 [Arthrobacter methylotrophus]